MASATYDRAEAVRAAIRGSRRTARAGERSAREASRRPPRWAGALRSAGVSVLIAAGYAAFLVTARWLLSLAISP